MLRHLLLLLLVTTTLHGQAPTPRDIAAHSRPAVVRITALSNGEPIGHGTGFLVTADGRLVTNYHVVRDADAVTVELSNGKVYSQVFMVSLDATRDLAILRIPAAGLPVLRFGDDWNAGVGDRVYVMGNPMGLDWTFTDGMVSGKRNLDGVALIQISAPISPGSSGGPVLNASGQVIGIATLTAREGQNLNMAVPIRYAKGLLAMNDTPRPFTNISNEPATRSTGRSLSTRSSAPLEPWAEVLVEEVKEVRDAAAKLGLSVTHEPLFEMLDNGETYDIEYTFRDRGVNVVLVGVCDSDCGDLDLMLFDGTGKLIVHDMGNGDRPILEFQVLSPGAFTLRVSMADCTQDPCGFAVQAYARPAKR